MHRIEVRLKSHLPDARGEGLVRDIRDLGITTVSGIRVTDVYWLDADLGPEDLERISRDILADPVTQMYAYSPPSSGRAESGRVVEVTYNPGVADPVEGTVMEAVRDLGVEGVQAVKTARRYTIEGSLDKAQLDDICGKLLVNPIVEHVMEPDGTVFAAHPGYRFSLNHVNILEGDDDTLAAVRREYGFSVRELETVIGHFHELGRPPTDAELETLGQTWSEHCGHKTFKGRVHLGGEVIDNILRSTIARATRELDRTWCLSVFVDNAGVMDFDGEWALCFKVETHNHPSAVEPYGGAATGIGGVVRDPLGTGLGARPIMNTDVFCFAPPDFPHEKVPPGVLHPRRVFKGVRAGVADYANRLGIPTLNGAILFDDRYLANPLVFCGTVGLLPAGMSRPGQQRPGDLVVVVGGRTGRDGIHGVTFASEQLTEESSTLSFTSVQIGNPIVEKKLIDILLEARDRDLYRRITDCGGGGLSSAVGEMAADTGVRVDLEKVPLKYSGLTYSEIWVSESQERMLIAVPPECLDDLMALFASEDVEAAAIGEFTDDHRLRLFYEGHLVADLSMDFLHDGLPQMEMDAVWEPTRHPEPEFDSPSDLGDALLQVLGDWNICSKEWVIRQYDHEVQGSNVLKPLVGRDSDGPGDAAIIRPLLHSDRGVIVSNGINPRYGEIDPCWMAASAIDESLRQIVAVGGDLDNFCWGDTRRPEMLGALVRAAQACYDMAVVYGTPFISGKDSLNNEFEFEGEVTSIPHTLLISAMGVMQDVNRAVTMDLKQAGDLIYLVGETRNEMGGSAYLAARGLVGNGVPRVNAPAARALMEGISSATARGLVRACHDCSDGGLGVALAEMAFAGGLGATVRLADVPLGEPIDRDDFILFAESNSRFLVEVSAEDQDAFEEALGDTPRAVIGQVTDSDRLVVEGLSGGRVLSRTLADLKDAWQSPLRW
jgi:phosphoribosylformylglycinamidine synthase